MAMKETVKSLRAYLILAGLLACASSTFQLIHFVKVSSSLPLAAAPTWLLILGYGKPILTILAALAFIYAGITLRYFLDKGDPRRILKIILFSGATAVLLGVISFILRSLYGPHAQSHINITVKILITWYLYANTKRLAKEAMISRKDELNEIFK